MNSTATYTETIEVRMQTGPDITDITGQISRAIQTSGVKNGILSAFMVGSTGSLTTIEYEPGVLEDLKNAVNQLAPPGRDYEHEKAWHDGNGHSHVQAALMGPSVVLPVRKGALRLGTWQQIVALNHDSGPRKRIVEITIMGNVES
jgi:secondary thiamine-phosphate synthase enzyme